MLKAYSILRSRRNNTQDNHFLSDTSKNPNSIKNKLKIETDESFPLQKKYDSIKKFPIYKKPQKNTKVFKAFEINEAETEQDKQNKISSKYLILSIGEKLSQLYSASFLTSLGVSPFTLAVLSYGLLNKVNAENAASIINYGKMDGFENLCSSIEQMIYCEQFQVLKNDTVLSQFALQLIPDHHWYTKIDHRNFIFDLKDKLEYIQKSNYFERLNSEFFSKDNFINMTSSLSNKYDHETFMKSSDWNWKIMRLTRGLNNETIEKFKLAFPAREYTNSNWNYNTHALVAALISLATGIGCIALTTFLRNRNCRRNTIDPRRIVLMEAMKETKKKEGKRKNKNPVKRATIASPTDRRPIITSPLTVKEKGSPTSDLGVDGANTPTLLNQRRSYLNDERRILSDNKTSEEDKKLKEDNKDNIKDNKNKLDGQSHFLHVRGPSELPDLIGNNDPPREIIFPLATDKEKAAQLGNVMASLREAALDNVDYQDKKDSISSKKSKKFSI